MEPKYLKLQEMLKDESTCKKLFVLSAEECSDVLQKEYDLDFSVAELTDIMNGIKAGLNDRQNDELKETDLEMVSGGRDNSAYGFGYSTGRFVPAVALVVCVVGVVACGW